MRSVNRLHVISIVLVSAGVLIVFGALFLSRQKSSHYQPEKRLHTPTALPTLIPTPTLAPGQIKATYTFYIQTTSYKTNSKGLGLNPSESGKSFIVDVGTAIYLEDFGIGRFHISQSSSQNIFTDPNPEKLPGSLPVDAIGGFRVYRSGFGTITVAESK